MTIKQLIDWAEEHKNEAIYERNKAESNRDGDTLWYQNGQINAYNLMLCKLDEVLDERASSERNP